MAQEPTAWEATKKSLLSGKTLYDDLSTIEVYRDHRESLRPWDRSLPGIVEQEGNRRLMWIIRPPSGYFIAFILAACMLGLAMFGVLPFVANATYIEQAWRDIEKPTVVYHDARVLFAVYIVVHMSSAFALWFIYLTEGFAKHQLELVPFCLTILCESVWTDVAFFVGRLDWLLALWFGIFIFTIVTQALLVHKDVMISFVFLFPQLAGSLTVIIYVIEFIKIHGKSLSRAV